MSPKQGQASAASSHANTRLAIWRLRRSIKQEDLARAVGLSRDTLSRLERGEIANPPLRYLSNCAIVLDVDLEELIEDVWREQWLTLRPTAPRPRNPSSIWSGYFVDDVPSLPERKRSERSN